MRSARIIDYGHFEHRIFRTGLFSMAFFVNLLISEKIYWYPFLGTVFDICGPGDLKNWFRYFTGFPNCLKQKKKYIYIFVSNIFHKQICIWKFSRISLDSQDLPMWTFWRAKYIVKCTMLKKIIFSRNKIFSGNTNSDENSTFFLHLRKPFFKKHER